MAPQQSYSAPGSASFPTGFQRTAHVPPAAIGPQFADGSEKDGGKQALIAVLALAGVGGAVLLLMHSAKKTYKPDFRGSRSRRSHFGQCAKSCSGDSDFQGCMSSCASG